jgi:hypothetical protein
MPGESEGEVLVPNLCTKHAEHFLTGAVLMQAVPLLVVTVYRFAKGCAAYGQIVPEARLIE